MKDMKIFSTDIKDKKEFTFDGSKLKFVKYNPKTNRYLYERFFSEDGVGQGRRMGWEIVIPVKKKQPDGTYVETYPSSEQFGKKGWFYPPRYTLEEMEERLNNEKK